MDKDGEHQRQSLTQLNYYYSQLYSNHYAPLYYLNGKKIQAGIAKGHTSDKLFHLYEKSIC
jgi:hypothetical protein